MMLIQCRCDLIRRVNKRVPFVLPFLVNDEQQFFKSDRPIPGSLWEIGSRKKRLLLCGHKNTGRPATTPGESLTDCHIDAVNVGTFFFINFDGHIVFV